MALLEIETGDGIDVIGSAAVIGSSTQDIEVTTG
jgi:hypothetical protein